MTNLPLTSKERKPSQLPGGQIRQDEKHHLLDCLKGNVTNHHGTFLVVHGKVLDGPAKTHFMVPGTCGTFGTYVNHMWWRNWTLSFEESILHGIFTSPTAWKMQRERREAVALVVGFHPPQEFQTTSQAFFETKNTNRSCFASLQRNVFVVLT